MTNDEAIELLKVCKTLAERASGDFPSGLPPNFLLTAQDLKLLEDFVRLQNNPVVAGPGLLKRLFNSAGLTQVDTYKLEQLRRLVFKRQSLGRDTSNGYKRENQYL
jgi:hypothetical protein